MTPETPEEQAAWDEQMAFEAAIEAIERHREEEYERQDMVAAAYRKLIGEPDPVRVVDTDAF